MKTNIDTRKYRLLIYMTTAVCVCVCSQLVNKVAKTNPGRFTWVVPIGTISIDFPQNLFLHLTSTKYIKIDILHTYIQLG